MWRTRNRLLKRFAGPPEVATLLLAAAQVSCGPYHVAAVASDGALFTWGDGFCGKLGHGGTDGCTSPRKVCRFRSPCEVLLHATLL